MRTWESRDLIKGLMLVCGTKGMVRCRFAPVLPGQCLDRTGCEVEVMSHAGERFLRDLL
jgi:ribosomal protein L35AE/L33A